MADKMTLSDFAAKVDNEGGLYEAVTGYGLTHEDLNREDDPEFYDLLESFVVQARKVRVLSDNLEDMLEDFYDEYE